MTTARKPSNQENRMTTHRQHLPQMDGGFFITDGGIETTLIFQDGFELPEFAAFTLLEDELGYERLRHYYRSYLDIVAAHGGGFVLKSPTRRASAGAAPKVGYTQARLERANRRSIQLLTSRREEVESKNEAIEQVDDVPGKSPAYYMINCAHPQLDKTYSGRARECFVHES